MFERIQQETAKPRNQQDYRLIYEYSFVWETLAKSCFACIGADKKPVTHFRALGSIYDNKGKELFRVTGNAAVLKIYVVPADLYILADIQDSATETFNCPKYQTIAARHVTHFTGKQQQEIDQLFKQIGIEKQKPEDEQNYKFVTQKLVNMNASDAQLFAYHIPNEQGETLISLGGGADQFDYTGLNYAIAVSSVLRKGN